MNIRGAIMNTLGKSIAAVFMWIILGLISLSGLLAQPGLGDTAAVVIVIAAMLVGMIGTGMIWSPEIVNRSSSDETPQTEVEKSKRQAGEARLALLLGMMGEDERERCKAARKRGVLNDTS